MNKKLKAIGRKLNFLSHLVRSIESSQLEEAFYSVYSYDPDSTSSLLAHKRVLTDQEREIIWQRLKGNSINIEEKAQAGIRFEISASQNIKVVDVQIKKYARIIGCMIMKAGGKELKQVFQQWKDQTQFVSGQIQVIQTSGHQILGNQVEANDKLRGQLSQKQDQLLKLKQENEFIETEGKLEFNSRQQELKMSVKRQALMRVAIILKAKCLKTPFYILKAQSEFVQRKKALLLSLPKPRMKQWWEKLMEEQYKHFYEQGKKEMPMAYRNVYQFIIEHRLMRQVITIQRFIRRRKMKRWFTENTQSTIHPRRKGKPLLTVDVSFLESQKEGAEKCLVF